MVLAGGTRADAPMSPDARSEPAGCFHCGLPVTAPGRFTVVVAGVPRQMCCAGCQAVTESILGAGLEAFYRTRSEAGSAGVEAAPLAELEIYDRPEVQASFVEPGPEGSREATLIVEGITCAACVWLNEQHLQRLPGVLQADVNYTTRRARVRWDPAQVRLSAILQAIQDIGYRAAPHDSAAAEQLEKRERRTALWRLFVAAFGMMQVMMYAYPAYIAGEGDMGADIASLLRWASLVLTLPVVLYSAQPFFLGAWRDLRLRRLGMDVPVALGVAAAFLGSCHATWTGTGEVYFDSVTMFVFFLLAGRWLEQSARSRAGEALRHLLRAMPARANRLPAWPGTRDTEVVPGLALQPGDHVLVRPGDAFPADGRVVDGETRVDESVLTGESLPQARRPGATVTGGTTNVSDPVVVRVEHTGPATRLSAIVRLVETAQRDRPRLMQLADRYAGTFVAAVLLVALVSAGAWWSIDPDRALVVAVAVLVVTCPCALSLAMPAALTVAIGALARVGLVVTRSRAIETAARVTHVVLDKTGTLTAGVFRVIGVTPIGAHTREDVCAIAAALAGGTDHPVARALRAAVARAPDATGLRHHPGAGVEAAVGDVWYRLGSRRYLEQAGVAVPDLPGTGSSTEVWLADAGGVLARFELGDQLRADAADTVRAFRDMGWTVILASGDRAEAVAAVAHQCGITQWHAGCTPEEKHRLVACLQADGAVVCMVGDGVNDAPVIAQADVSVAMAGGAVLAQQAADLVLSGDRLGVMPAGFAHAARTMRIVRQNLSWALAYNILAVPLAALGFVSPWAAGLGMATSSVLVVFNALRLRAVLPTPASGRAWRPAPVGA
jgi:Cu2+-exporting ATPase